MKKALTIVAVLALAAIIAGCGSTLAPTTTVTQPVTTTVQPTTTTEAPTTTAGFTDNDYAYAMETQEIAQRGMPMMQYFGEACTMYGNVGDPSLVPVIEELCVDIGALAVEAQAVTEPDDPRLKESYDYWCQAWEHEYNAMEDTFVALRTGSLDRLKEALAEQDAFNEDMMRATNAIPSVGISA